MTPTKSKRVHNNIFQLFFLISIVCLYTYIYEYVWINFNVKHFDYLGYSYNDCKWLDIFTSRIIVLFPLLFYKNKEKISTLIASLLYLFAYIPMIMSIRFMQKPMWNDEIISIQLVLMFSMIMFFNANHSFFSLKIPNYKKILNIKYILFITIVVSGLLFIAFKEVMSLVSLNDVYNLRENANTIQNSGLNGYLLMWATHVLYPLILLFGLYSNKNGYIILGIGLFIFSYSLSGLKSNLFLPFLIFILYHIYQYVCKNILIYGLLGIILFSCLLLLLDDSYFIYQSIFFMRTISISGLLFGIYIDFFAFNEFTHFSHISLINGITQSYNFNKDIGLIIGDYYNANLNACFLITDGYAAYGAIGILIISIIFFLFLITLNSITNRLDLKYVTLMLLPSLTSLLNASFFTFLLSCGVFLIIPLFLFGLPIYNSNQKKE